MALTIVEMSVLGAVIGLWTIALLIWLALERNTSTMQKLCEEVALLADQTMDLGADSAPKPAPDSVTAGAAKEANEQLNETVTQPSDTVKPRFRSSTFRLEKP